MNLTRMTWTTALLSIGLSLFACGGDSAPNTTVDNLPSEVVEDSDLFKAANHFADSHPDTGTRGWDGACAALMYQFCMVPSATSAKAAYDNINNKHKIESTKASEAPVGAFHYFSWGDDGHVGVDLNGGGQKVFMASTHLEKSWNTDIGWNSVDGYLNDNKDASYLGWSMEFGGTDTKTCDPNRTGH